MSESLDSILSNDEAPAEEAAEQSAAASEASDAGETPVEAKKPDETESETDEIDADESDDLGDLRYSGLKKAARKERKFRQAAEKQAKELQRQLDHLAGQMQAQRQQQAAPQQIPQQQQTQEKKPDEWDALLTKGPEYVQEAISRAFAERERKEEAKRQEQTKVRVASSRAQLLQREPDAHEFLTEFVAMARADSKLEQMMLTAEDPADFAYQYAKETKRIAQFGSIDELVAAERAKWESERGIASSTGQSAPAAQARPQHKTIAGMRGSSASVRRSGEDPDSMSSILS